LHFYPTRRSSDLINPLVNEGFLMKSVKRLFHSNNITCSLKILCLIYRKTMLIFCLFKFKPCIFNAYLHITNNELTLHTLDVHNYPLIARVFFMLKYTIKIRGYYKEENT